MQSTGLTLGNFDGVHLGHQSMIAHLLQHAASNALSTQVLIFEPQAAEFFSDTPPARLTTFEEKAARIQSLGVDQVTPIAFNQALAQLTPEAFVKDILVGQFQAEYILVGDDFRFGRDRAGDINTLRALGSELGFTTESLSSIMFEGERVSSTAIRQALKAGQFDRAAQLLGRPYTMSGIVQPGDKRGRLLGYPTANIDPARRVLPFTGVYAVNAELEGKHYPGMANLGCRPTLDGLKTLLEVHLFDFNRDIYGKQLSVEFIKKIRDEQKFSSVEALQQQLQADEREVLSNHHASLRGT